MTISSQSLSSLLSYAWNIPCYILHFSLTPEWLDMKFIMQMHGCHRKNNSCPLLYLMLFVDIWSCVRKPYNVWRPFLCGVCMFSEVFSGYWKWTNSLWFIQVWTICKQSCVKVHLWMDDGCHLAVCKGFIHIRNLRCETATTGIVWTNICMLK